MQHPGVYREVISLENFTFYNLGTFHPENFLRVA